MNKNFGSVKLRKHIMINYKKKYTCIYFYIYVYDSYRIMTQFKDQIINLFKL